MATLNNNSTRKQLHGGYKCYTRNLTLTTRDPWPLSMGMRLLHNMLKDQPSSFIDYAFYPEYSPDGMFHFHGTIYYRNTVHYNSFLSMWKRYYGFVKSDVSIDPNPLRWHFYCRKDQHLITKRMTRIAKHGFALLGAPAPTFFEVPDKGSLKPVYQPTMESQMDLKIY